MDMEAMKKHGVFSWNELVTPDVVGAKAFYGELFGWNLKDMNNGGMDYTIAEAGEREVAGIMAMPEDANGMPPMWGGYVTVDDLETRTQRAVDLGGKIYVEPREIPDLGRFAVIADPQGAMLTLISYHGCN